MDSNLLAILALGAMAIGLLFYALPVPPSGPRRRAQAVFVFGAAALLGLWLLKRPDVVADVTRSIATTLLGTVEAVVRMVGRW